MSELIAIAFDDRNEADRVLNELQQLQTEYLVDPEDAVVVTRDADGKVRLKQSVNLVGTAAATGALSGRLADYGIDDNFIRRLAEAIRPDSSALFVLARKFQPEKVLAELSRFRGRVIRSSSARVPPRPDPPGAQMRMGDVRDRAARPALVAWRSAAAG
jgi:uncharacterized membrane protein